MKLLLFLFLATSAFAKSPATLPATTPWDVKALARVPAVAWMDESKPVRSLFYEGEESEGKKTGVFAYYASPATLGTDSTPG
ncbi:MAG: acylamino acid-releasing protein, partial [Chthoniobacteraceae bacterium]